MTKSGALPPGKATYWGRPRYGSSALIVGPVQFNWYGGKLCVHVTWPAQKTFAVWSRGR